LDVTQNTEIKELRCRGNQIASLDLTQNAAMYGLSCANNQLTSMDVSQNSALITLSCDTNQISNIDVSMNANLSSLFCSSNQISLLDLTQNFALDYLQCSNNQLTCLNVKNGLNTGILYFWALNNPDLLCIEVDDVAWSEFNWNNVDPVATFSTDCNASCVVGIEEHSLSNFQIYPNPTREFINLEFGEIVKVPTVTIRNVSGHIVLSNTYPSTDRITIEMDVSSGLYFLQIGSDATTIASQMVIKE